MYSHFHFPITLDAAAAALILCPSDVHIVPSLLSHCSGHLTVPHNALLDSRTIKTSPSRGGNVICLSDLPCTTCSCLRITLLAPCRASLFTLTSSIASTCMHHSPKRVSTSTLVYRTRAALGDHFCQFPHLGCADDGRTQAVTCHPRCFNVYSYPSAFPVFITLILS